MAVVNVDRVDMTIEEVCFLKRCWYCLCDFRLQKSQGTKHRAQVFPPNEMHADEQGPHRQC